MSTTKSSSKVWFITGASSGFGRAIAVEALRRGDSVVATARGDLALDGLSAEEAARVEVIKLDVTRAEDVGAGREHLVKSVM